MTATMNVIRLFVIHKLRHLQFLDSTKVKSGERKEAERVGEFMIVVRPTISLVRI